MSTTVTAGPMMQPGAVDEARYAKFLAKMVRFYRKACNDGKRDYAGWTNAECVSAAEFYCRAYRHQFRVLVPVEK